MSPEQLARLDWILTKAQIADENGELRRSRDVEFINDLTDRRENYGDKIRVSEKQWEWLEAIAERCC